jgi:hypothetical protein
VKAAGPGIYLVRGGRFANSPAAPWHRLNKLIAASWIRLHGIFEISTRCTAPAAAWQPSLHPLGNLFRASLSISSLASPPVLISTTPRRACLTGMHRNGTGMAPEWHRNGTGMAPEYKSSSKLCCTLDPAYEAHIRLIVRHGYKFNG